MHRKIMAVTLGLLMMFSMSTVASAHGGKAGQSSAVVKVEGTVVSVTPVCPAPPADGGAPADPGAPCGGQQPTAYEVLVQTESGEQYTLTYAPDTQVTLEGAQTKIADLPVGTKAEIRLVDGSPTSVEFGAADENVGQDDNGQSGDDQNAEDQNDDGQDDGGQDDGGQDDGGQDDGDHHGGGHDDDDQKDAGHSGHGHGGGH